MTVEILTPRDVPLGGPRAMTVRRTLPQKQRTFIGAWCFADHYGPDLVDTSGGMNVPPHPHTGLQTVSWLFSGEIEHRDSIGSHAVVRPGELNLMTAGRGISHSEVSTPETTVLHGMQLWVALPGRARFTEPNFEHYVPETITVDGASVRVFLGSLAGARSPVATFTPLLGAEIVLQPGQIIRLPVDETYEHGVVVDEGTIEFDGMELVRAELGYVAAGLDSLTLRNTGQSPARMLLLGGPPFEEHVIMWWNFMGRTHEDIAAYRAAWQTGVANSAGSEQFGTVDGYDGAVLPAPALPNSRLEPRA